MLELVYMSMGEISDAERNILYSCIAPERREQLKMRKNQTSADRSLAAEALARVMLLQAVRKIGEEKLAQCDCIPDDFPYSGGNSGSLQAKDFVIYRDENGKPYQGTVPGLYFNCSHSGSMVACAIADAEVGVDIQKITDGSKVKERIFCKQELSENPCFTEIWAKKESYLKLTGEGLRREMATLYVRIMQENGEVQWFGGPVCDGYYLYACVGGETDVQKNGWKMYRMTLQEVLKTIRENG